LTRNRRVVHTLLLIVIPLIVFGNCLRHDFVWDDTIYLVGNPVYADFDFRRILTTPANSVEYLPIRDVSYAIDYALWGASPTGFHATNLLLYILVCGAAYLLTRRLAADLFDDRDAPRTALAVTLLFAVHPLHSEVVAFITSRNTLLASLFFFLSLYFFLTHLTAPRGLWRYWSSLLCFLLAAYAKAIALIQPLAVLLMLAVSTKRREKRAYLSLAPFGLIAAATFVLFRDIAEHSRMIDAGRFGTDWQTRVATTLEIPYFYLAKLLVPINLAALYEVPFSDTLSSLPFLGAACGIALIIIFSKKMLIVHRPVVTLLLLMVILLLPVLHLFPTSPIVADRYFFLPSYAAIYLLVYTFQHCTRGTSRYATWLFLLLGSTWSILAWQQNYAWQTDLTLWQHAVTAQPAVARSWEHLGREQFGKGNYAAAFTSFARARALNPADPNYDFFQGYLWYVKGQSDAAIAALIEALQRDRHFIEALDLLGDLYASLGEWQRAIDCFQRVIASPQVDPGAYKQGARAKLAAIGTIYLPEKSARP